jgi:hypothetical protein
VVPSDEELGKKQEAQKQKEQIKAINEQVDKGIQAGVEQGVQKIASELTAGFLASHAATPGEEAPGGVPGTGAPPGGSGGGLPGAPPGLPGMGGPPRPANMDEAARQAQGAKPTPMSNASALPANVVGNQRRPMQPGMRMPPIGGGPG